MISNNLRIKACLSKFTFHLEEFMANKRFLFTSFILASLIGVSAVIALLASGYRFDLKKREITGTGIISINSFPDGSLIFLNDKPTGATNTSLTSLKPGKYTLRLEKQGFTNWEKEIIVEKELVTKVEAILIPLFPELKPLTFTSTKSPLLSPDGQKIIYTALSNSVNGLWLLDLSDRPFNLANKPSSLLQDTEEYEYSKGEKTFSPDSKNIMMSNIISKDPTSDKKEQTFLLDLVTRDIKVFENKTEILLTWEKELKLQQQKLLEGINETLAEKISSLPSPFWSPDNTKVLYESRNEKNIEFKIINLEKSAKDSENNKQENKEITVYTAPDNQFTKLVWYPDSKHLLILEKEKVEATNGKISLMEFDSENKMQIFSGTVIQDHMFPYPNGAKIIILTSFNPENEQYNLYSINLR